MNSCDNESLPEEIRVEGTPTNGSKTTLQSIKVRNTYCRVLQSSGNRVNASTTSRVRPKTTPSETAESNTCGSN
ncbi:hypothetical protein Taro_012872 [Colocasia esculenta]|uniref:Uncharacterized protein n=1 Tax=Colocasia esculenta TaxID=4460 RepID=A0A843UE20_COLES|nr:hypothetical protein [Colocasia esculenta]